MSYTRVGLTMRATSFDLEAATMIGVNVDTVIVFTSSSARLSPGRRA